MTLRSMGRWVAFWIACWIFGATLGWLSINFPVVMVIGAVAAVAAVRVRRAAIR